MHPPCEWVLSLKTERPAHTTPRALFFVICLVVADLGNIAIGGIPAIALTNAYHDVVMRRG